MRKCCEKRPVLQEEFNLYLHIDKYVSCIIMGSVQLDVEGGICIVEMFSVEHVHLHLVMVAFKENTKTELMFDPVVSVVVYAGK